MIDLLSTTYHHWTKPASPEQLQACVQLRAHYDVLASTDNEIARLELEIEQMQNADDPVPYEMEERALALEAAQDSRKTILADIESLEDALTDAGQDTMVQLRIALRPATGRTEAAYRGLLAEAGQSFKDATGHKYNDQDDWPEEDKPTWNALIDGYNAWARMMAQIAGLYQREIDLLKYDPDDYSDDAGPWEETPIPITWRDPESALDTLPESLIHSTATQALIASRSMLDGRFFPAQARQKYANGSAGTSQPLTTPSPASSTPKKKQKKAQDRKTGAT